MEENRISKLLEESKAIELKPVVSTNIYAVGYSEDTKLLKVAFKSKNSLNTYLYEGVEPELYGNMLKSESVGRFIYDNVIKQKEKYKYIKI